MSILVRENPEYRAIPLSFRGDNRLGFKEIGILTYLLTDDRTEIGPEEMIERGPDGREGVRSGWRKLVDLGYIEHSQEHGEDGHIEHVYHIKSVPRKVRGLSDAKLRDAAKEKPNTDVQKQVSKTLAQVWKARVGAPNYGRIGRAAKKLSHEDPKEVRAAFQNYLEMTEERYYSVEAFANRWKQYLNRKKNSDLQFK